MSLSTCADHYTGRLDASRASVTSPSTPSRTPNLLLSSCRVLIWLVAVFVSTTPPAVPTTAASVEAVAAVVSAAGEVVVVAEEALVTAAAGEVAVDAEALATVAAGEEAVAVSRARRPPFKRVNKSAPDSWFDANSNKRKNKTALSGDQPHMMGLRALLTFRWAMWVVGVVNLRSSGGDLWALRNGFAKSHDTCGLVPDLWAHVLCTLHGREVCHVRSLLLRASLRMMGFLIPWATVGSFLSQSVYAVSFDICASCRQNTTVGSDGVGRGFQKFVCALTVRVCNRDTNR